MMLKSYFIELFKAYAPRLLTDREINMFILDLDEKMLEVDKVIKQAVNDYIEKIPK